ncbi:DUF551 domain-containing protein [Enterobacter hormaechei]|uniref:DUF551 domain-containing protein n=1 Tax=Enterobacter hormaechei TaxID=158836 RepID=UPI002FEFF7A7
MSTLTKEWLQQTIAELEEERDATPGAVNEDAAKALAAMKLSLASLEAEPVAWRSLYYENHGLLTGSKNVLASWQKQGWECEPLYTAPPASVSVPDELPPHEDESYGSEDDCYKAGRVEGWNACRAAMLQGKAEPVSQRDELGWVACSERLPDNGGESRGLYLCWGTYGDGDEPGHIPAFFFIHPTHGWHEWEPVEDDCIPRDVTITHWMPLPAAPQQEVKP